MLQRAGQYSSCAVIIAFKGYVHDSWLWSAGMARVGSSKHSPGRRITFPSILPLFNPPSQPQSTPLEPVKEGEQLSTKPVLPSKKLCAQSAVCASFACCLLASMAGMSG